MEALKRKRNKKGVGGKLFFLTFYFVLGCRQLTYNVVIVVPGLSCGMWGLVPWPGIEPGSHALGAWSLSHWTIREVQCCDSFR